MSRSVLWGIRLLIVASVAFLAWSVWSNVHPSPASTPPTPAPSASTDRPNDAKNTRLTGFSYKRFGPEGDGISIEAASNEGQDREEVRLRQAVVVFVYLARGQKGKTRVTADEAIMTPTVNKGVFQGHVVAQTEEGFELKTDQLIYRGDKGIARTETPVTFKRKDVSGSSRGLVYDASEGTVELPAEAYIRIDDEKVGPTEIRGGRAYLTRQQGVVRFEGGVVMTHGSERLVAKSLNVGYSETDFAVTRFQAMDDVVLSLSGQGALPGTTTPLVGQGARTLKARKLIAVFRPDRTLQEVSALDDAEMIMAAPTGESGEPKRLSAKAIALVFDEQGRITEVQGQKGAKFETRPPKGEPFEVTCQRLLLRVDPPTGSMKAVVFEKDVALNRGKVRATSGRARLDAAKNTMEFTDEPRMADSERGAELVAKAIQLDTATQNLVAKNNVRQALQAPSGSAAAGPFGSGAATVITSASFEYDAAQSLGSYQGGVLLRAGKDEIRAQQMKIANPSGGARRLEAAGQVASTMAPRSAGPDSGKADIVEARSASLAYDEGKKTITYDGDVTLIMGELRTRSPKATLTLAADGAAIQDLVAGEPVDAYQDKRHATGQRLTYSPAKKQVNVSGKLVTFKDLDQQIQGKSLTFFLGDDRIIVDGQELGRTETLIRPKETPKP